MAREDIENLKGIKGEVRGITLETDANYILKKMGEEGLKNVQAKSAELGWEIFYKNIKAMSWYPVGIRAVSLIAAKEAFGWGDQDIKEMGNNAPKYSFVASTMLRYFVSVRKVFKETEKYWEKHYTAGRLESFQIDEEKKFAILRLKEFNIHPLFCHYFAGYFLRISQFVVKSEEITIQESACGFSNGQFHEYIVKWR